MKEVDPRAVSALAAQLGQRRETLRAGAVRVGWKLGVGNAERIADETAVGHLTTATLLAADATFPGHHTALLCADAEVAVTIGRDLAPGSDALSVRRAISAYSVALELVDLTNADDGPEAVIATNIFHRAVAFGPPQPTMPTDGVEGRLVVNGAVRATAPAPTDLFSRIAAASRLLGALDERFQEGDRVITGSVVQVQIGPGDHVTAEFDVLGRVRLAVTA